MTTTTQDAGGGGVERRVAEVVERVVAGIGLECYDLLLGASHGARTLEVIVDRAGGVDLEAITEASRALSAALDEADAFEGTYVLEVSSPGVERTLRTLTHLRGAIGEMISVKYRDGGAAHRVRGELVGVDEEAIRVVDTSGSEIEVALEDVTKARTVFDWTPTPKPGKGSRPGRKHARRAGASDPTHKESAHR